MVTVRESSTAGKRSELLFQLDPTSLIRPSNALCLLFPGHFSCSFELVVYTAEVSHLYLHLCCMMLRGKLFLPPTGRRLLDVSPESICRSALFPLATGVLSRTCCALQGDIESVLFFAYCHGPSRTIFASGRWCFPPSTSGKC